MELTTILGESPPIRTELENGLCPDCPPLASDHVLGLCYTRISDDKLLSIATRCSFRSVLDFVAACTQPEQFAYRGMDVVWEVGFSAQRSQ